MQFGTTSGAAGFTSAIANGETVYVEAYDSAATGNEWYRTTSSSATADLVGDLRGDEALIVNGKFVFSGMLATTAVNNRSLFVDRSDRASITGVVWQDRNADGTLGTSDQNISGRTIWLDTDNDSQVDTGEPRTLTNASGEYQFFDLVPATYRVRQQLPSSSWLAVSPATNLVTINAAAGASYCLTNFTSRIVNAGVIRGSVFDDFNHNGVLDGIDRYVPTASARTIYLRREQRRRLPSDRTIRRHRRERRVRLLRRTGRRPARSAAVANGLAELVARLGRN